MNWQQIEGKWEQYKGKAQQKWGKLTDDDLDVIKGNQKELAGRIQELYGISKEEAEEEMKAFSRSLN
ncbi:CsbD family protein [Catenovulum sp. 2E275]|uniref:CsbD family protein n=1 Tax=Catenovulum sp. 2E275 TaxID=2980497 RepID=UPI0021D07522|nr:CsbD family protein [Catenovulum sp. 2E275]MCU4674381.1 CsbD family protein [Catenovulum sp. 2E275]